MLARAARGGRLTSSTPGSGVTDEAAQARRRRRRVALEQDVEAQPRRAASTAATRAQNPRRSRAAAGRRRARAALLYAHGGADSDDCGFVSTCESCAASSLRRGSSHFGSSAHGTGASPRLASGRRSPIGRIAGHEEKRAAPKAPAIACATRRRSGAQRQHQAATSARAAIERRASRRRSAASSRPASRGSECRQLRLAAQPATDLRTLRAARARARVRPRAPPRRTRGVDRRSVLALAAPSRVHIATLGARDQRRAPSAAGSPG